MNNRVGIILVDDNDIDLMIGGRLISVINPDIVLKTFAGGEAFLQWIQSESNQCIAQKVIVFIDIYMPKMNGFEVAEKAYKLFENKGCTIECYLLSATIDDYDLQKIERHPLISGFIGKPITQAILNELVGNSKVV